MLDASPLHCFIVNGSTSHKTKVVGHTEPRLVIVFRSVMKVPPIVGSLILAWKAMMDTNMLYTVTWKLKVFFFLIVFFFLKYFIMWGISWEK